VHDKARVRGGGAGFALPPVSFTFNAAAVANAAAEGTFTATSVPSGALGAGSYTYVGTVGSNANYIGATSADEPLTVDKAQLAITTTIHDAGHNVEIGRASGRERTEVPENATATDGIAGFALPPVSFAFNAGAVANAAAEGTSTATSVPSGALGAGSYTYVGTVGSNANYIGATSADEPLTVDKAQLAITTTIHDAGHNV